METGAVVFISLVSFNLLQDSRLCQDERRKERNLLAQSGINMYFLFKRKWYSSTADSTFWRLIVDLNRRWSDLEWKVLMVSISAGYPHYQHKYWGNPMFVHCFCNTKDFIVFQCVTCSFSRIGSYQAQSHTIDIVTIWRHEAFYDHKRRQLLSWLRTIRWLLYMVSSRTVW